MTTSQEFIPIQDVSKNLVFEKDGSVAIILSVSAVNFALLFETEQISIIDSFAGLLNSLSFPIQIVIYSKIMDVSSYLHTIDNAIARQANPLLKNMTFKYRDFVEKSIKDNNVLDKRFYICIKLSSLELGLLPSNMEEKTKKVATLLEPRRDHLIRQLDRLGLKAKQLTTEEIIKLFYEIYNPPITAEGGLPAPTVQINVKTAPLLEIHKPEELKPTVPRVEDNLPPKLRPIKAGLTQPAPVAVPQVQMPPAQTAPAPQPVMQAAPQQVSPALTPPPALTQAPASRNSPFVVEELPDDDGP